MTVNDIERLENAARSVFGHEDTDGSDRSETTQSRALSLFARMLDYLQKRGPAAPAAVS